VLPVTPIQEDHPVPVPQARHDRESAPDLREIARPQPCEAGTKTQLARDPQQPLRRNVAVSDSIVVRHAPGRYVDAMMPREDRETFQPDPASVFNTVAVTGLDFGRDFYGSHWVSSLEVRR
jgi:hypothetical protein